MTKARDLADLLDATGDVKSGALDNVPPSNDASALTTGTLPNARLPDNISVGGTEGLKLPVGTTAQRGSTQGQIRFNTTTGLAEYYDGSNIRIIDSPPTITSVSPTEVESAAGGNETFTINGSNFASGAVVKFISNTGTEITASTTTFINSGQVTAEIAKSSFVNAQEPYDVKVVALSGLSGALENQINVDNAPTWSTASGNIANINHDDTGTHATVSATDPEGDTVSYSETGGTVLSTNNLTLNSNTGAISGDPTDPTGGTSNTLNFTLRATANSKTSDRAFNIVVTNPIADSGGGAGYGSSFSVTTNATGVTNNSQTQYNANCTQASGDPNNHWLYNCSGFKIHTGHSGIWPHYTCVNVVSGSGTPRVLNQWQWYKHTNAAGNFDIYGSNQNITSSNFTTLSNWTNLGRGHAGGQGSASDCTVMAGTFNSNSYGYRWYMFVIRDGDPSSLSQPSVGQLNAYAMYGARLNKI